ncbi:hemicentin-1-like [Etheostoma cragini]|uniref:hemicentin-1-like n=1 Tax=Etheostoma cragini TaxID=417921 RepID=UPI00155DE345|nr:hemicentin-1-like [Etheostoma cragini]
MRGAAMGSTAATSGFVVLFLSMTVAQSRNRVTYISAQICAVRGSTVDLRVICRQPSAVKRRPVPVENIIWFTEMQEDSPVDLRTDSEYAGRVKYYCDMMTCTLRITDLRESDSAEYKFRFKHRRVGRLKGSPGVTLSVTDPDLQVQVRRWYLTWAQQFCQSTCHLPDRPSYIWYKNGQKIQEETSSSYSDYVDPADSYSCAVKGHADVSAPPVCVFGQICNRVTYTARSICVSNGSSLDISCTYNSYEDQVESAFWFSPERSSQWQNPSQPGDLSKDSQYEGRVQVETERGRSTLRISDLRESDSAEYHFKFITPSFEWRSSLPGTTLTVTALQVQVIRLTVKQYGTYAELKCLSSCSPAGPLSYVWFNNGRHITRVKTSTITVWFDPSDVFSCALKGHEKSPSPSVLVQGQEDWGVTYTSTHICAVKGSTVDITCSYKYPSWGKDSTTTVKTKLWFTKMNNHEPVDLITDSEYSGRVQYSDNEKSYTLRISDLRERDSAEYKFMFTTNQEGGRYTGHPGVTLSVTALQVQVIRLTVKQSRTYAELKCLSSCSPAGPLPYVWFNNGRHITRVKTSTITVWFDPSDVFSCALKGHEKSPSPSVLIQGQEDWGVTYTSTHICAVKGSTVDITCSYTYPSSINATVERRFWFTKLQDEEPVDLRTDSKYSGRVQYICKKKSCTLRISDLRETDSAEYKFRFTTNQEGGRYTGSPGVTLSVTVPDFQVQVTRSSSQAELRCHSSCNVNNPSYVWFNNGQKMYGERSLRVYVEDNNSYYNSYSCAVTGYEDHRSPPVYGPKRPSVSVSPSAEIVEGRSVTLTCSSDANPAAIYTWYKENVKVKPPSEDPQLVFSSILSSDSGQYYCTAENELGTKTSQYRSIDVKYGPKVVSLSLTPTGDIRENSRVTLTCSSDANPAATYTWYKNGNPRNKNTQLVFSSIKSSDSGQYYCVAENKLGRRTSKSISIDVKYGPKRPSVSVSPSAEIVEGSSVTLTCSSHANPAAKYTWYKENVKVKPPSEGPQLVFSSILSSDSGQYYCRAENELGTKTSQYKSIDVKYGPKVVSLSLTPTGDIRENSRVTLTCSSDANPAATYTWYKNGIPRNKNTQLVFSSIQSSDSGQYYCVAENKLGRRTSKSISIDVKYGPKRPSVSVSRSAEIVEGSSVTLTCSSDANPAANYTWYKENQTLLHGPEGSYNFTSIRAEDSGNYYCKSENQFGQSNSSVFVDVQYGPKRPSVSVSPSAEIVEGSSVNLTCSSDANPAANYTWYKENEDSPKASGQIFTITDVRPEHSGDYSCEAQNRRGRQSSTLHLTVVAGSWKLTVAATVPAIFLTIIFISLFLWIIKKRSSKQPSEPGERPDNRDQMQLAEQHNELPYASIHFPKKPARPRRHKEVEKVVYAAVKFKSASPAPSNDTSSEPPDVIYEAVRESAEDPDALYSTVDKKRNLYDGLDKVKSLRLIQGQVSHVIQGQDSWGVTYTSEEICAVKGSTVDITCSYTYPPSVIAVTESFWHLGNGVDLKGVLDYKDRVQYNCGNNKNCTSAPQMQVNKVTFNQSITKAELSCHSKCSSYTWIKNGQKVPGEASSYTAYLNPGDSISCALKGQEIYHTPSLYAPDVPSVLVRPSGDIMEGSSVNLTCSSDANIVANYTWYKEIPNQKEKPLSEGPQLVFISILSSDSGQYYCTAENELGRRTSANIFINVKYGPKRPSVSVSPSAEIVEGRSVTLTCSSDANPATNYTWYKENVKVKPPRAGPQLVFSSILSSDSGQYYCRAENKLGRRTSKSISINVKYGPKRLSVSVSPSAEIVEGRSVTLTCSSDANPAAIYTWYKENVKVKPPREGPQLVFSSILSSDSGQYYCRAENELGTKTSPYTSVDVKYGPKRPSVSVSPSAEIVEGSSVTLTCSSDANPAANYTWYKENQTLLHGPEGSYNFTSIRSEDRGNYYCKSENQFGHINSTSVFIDVQYGPKRPSVSVSPSAEIVEGSSVTLTCSSDANPAANYTWYKKNVLSEGPLLVFISIQSSESGQYYCTAENMLGRRTSANISINVKYGPKRPSVSVSPSAEIVEGGSVTLTCSSDANPAANYTWYKENQTLLHGPEGSYHFTSIRSEDRGNYYCKSENQYGLINSSSLSIDVHYGPQRPSVSVSPSAEIVEGSSVTLTCSSDANPAANYTWYKENEDSPKASGQIFTITDVRPEHSGDYSCEAQNRRGRKSSTLHLTVVTGTWKSVISGTITAVILIVVCLSVFLLIRKKRTSKQLAEPGDGSDDREQVSKENNSVQRSGMNFTTPVSTSPRARQTLSTATSDQLASADTRTKKKKKKTTEWSILLSNLTVPVLRRETEVRKRGRIQLHATVQSTKLLNLTGNSSISLFFSCHASSLHFVPD